MGIYQTNELDTLTAQPIIDRLMNTLEDFSKNISDMNFIQKFIIMEDGENEFELFKNPLIDTIIFIVNGVAYTHSKYINIIERNGVYYLKWIGNFELKKNFVISIVYNYEKEDD